MIFKSRKNPTLYITETSQYIDDLQRITLLRDKCSNIDERNEYTVIINVMQQVLVFMNSLGSDDKKQLKR